MSEAPDGSLAAADGVSSLPGIDGVAFGMFDILQVDPNRPTRDSLLEHLGHGVLADELGLDYLFVAERHFMPEYRAATPSLLLAWLAGQTQHMRLGVMAYTLALHNPALLAEEISALDHLSGGRLEVGVGLGHRPQEIDALGMPSQHRQAMFLEVAAVMRRLWEGQPVTHDGALYHLRDVLVDPPVQRPHPPLWYAGNDPAAATWAGRNGYSLAIGFQMDEALAIPSSAFRGVRESSGQRLAVMRHLYVGESDGQVREEVVDDLMRLGTELAANPRRQSDSPLTPMSRDDAERHYDDQDRRQIVVAGSPETVATKLAATIRTLRADVFLANVHLTGVEDARVRRTLTLYANGVVPRVREMLRTTAN